MISTKTMSGGREIEDAELVSQSRSGNRKAFERIVMRYQALVCSLAYSATGNIGRSEELAQDTFLAAWQQLGTLREPQQLRSWLCGIVRNLARNTLRRQAREPLHQAEPLDATHEAPSLERLPSEQAVSREEEAIVWRALEGIPDLYKEPLVLFYREGCSVAAVAQQLELSEGAVKQRLARGREMLREETAAVVEGALQHSRPGRAFTLAVMAAVPAVVVGSASTAAAGVAGKASGPAAAKALLATAGMGAWLGGLAGLLGGAVGCWASWQTARYQRERELLRRSYIAFAVTLVVFNAPFVTLGVIGWRVIAGHPLVYSLTLVGWILGFVIINLVWSFRLNRQMVRIRAEETAAGVMPLPEPPVVRGVSRWAAKWEGRQWRSRWSLLGLPLIDINFSSPDAESLVSKATVSALLPRKPQVARGWIAMGDRAHGVLFACGNIAVGGIAIGGRSVGALAIGGAAGGLVAIGGGAVGVVAIGGAVVGVLAWGGGAVGLWALGGLALGWMAWGGAAFAWRAAYGGLACAHDTAVGAKAIAAHANDAAARGFISHDWFFRTAEWQQAHVIPWIGGAWFITAVLAFSLLVPLLLFAVGYRRKRTVLPMALAVLATFISFAAVGDAQAAAPASMSGSVTLSNGIRIVAAYFRGSKNVSIFTFLPLGLAGDGPKQAQWSHLVEHLVIRSTIPGDLSKANAETTAGEMRLDFYGNVNDWETGLSHCKRWLEGVPFTQASLEQEKPKVKSECGFTAQNLATHKFALAAWAQGMRHGETNAALLGDIDRVSLSEIQAYRDEHLVILSNVVVCVVGGVEPSQVFSNAAEKFGTLRSNASLVAPLRLHPGNREMTWDLDARHLVMTWPIPAAANEDFASLLAAGYWLNMQFFSSAELKGLTGMVFAGADLRTPEGDFFYVSASLRPGISFQQVQQILEQQVQRLTSPGEDLSMLPMLRGQLAESLTTIPDVATLKAQLPPDTDPEMLEGNIGLQWGMQEFRYGSAKAALAKRLAELTAEDIRRVAKKYLRKSTCSTVAIRGPR